MSGSPQELVERGLAYSSADGCVVIVEERSDANLRWANNTLTTNGVTSGRTVTVVSVVGGSTGVVTRQGVGVEDLPALVEASAFAARGAPEASDAAPLVGQEASWGGWEDLPVETGIGVFDSFARDLGEALRHAAATQRLLYGYAYHQVTSTFLGSSTGLRCRFDQPSGHVEVNVKSSDLSASSWVGTPTRDFGDVDVAAIQAELDRRLGWAHRAVELPAGRYDTILPPGAVADLMIYLYWSAGARPAHEGRSAFSRPGGGTLVGDRVTDIDLTLRSDPAAEGLECPPFVIAGHSEETLSVFDNGSRLEPTTWIQNGTVNALVQTRSSAELTGLPYTPYVDNLSLYGAGGAGAGGAGSGGAGSGEAGSGGSGADGGAGVDQLVAGTERGLLLTCLWYIREVDPRTLLLTGLTRDGVYLVEGGEIIGAVNNFRFNESPLAVLARASGVGATERTLPREWCDYFTRVAMPALRVEGFNMSSVSQAS